MIERLRQYRRRLIGICHTGDFCRSLHFRRTVRPLSVRQALDAGCGDGWYTLYLARQKSASVEACDLNSERIADLKRRVGDLPIRPFVADLVQLTSMQNHDLVICIDVLEHVLDYRTAVRNLCAALQPGGLLLVHVPRNLHRTYVGIKVDNPLHVWEGFSPDQLCEAFKSNDLRIVCVKHTFGPLASIAWELEQRLGRAGAIERLLLSVIYPLFKVMIWLDAFGDHKHGNGLYLVAAKEC